MSNNHFDGPGGLSPLMAGRYHAMFPRYRERTLKLLSLTSKLENSYKAVAAKSDVIHQSTGEERNYIRTLTNAMSLDVPINDNAISKIVCEVRARYGYPRFEGNVAKQCLQELYKLFIIKQSAAPGADGKNHRVYILQFALLAE